MKFLYPTGGRITGYGVITAPNHKGIPWGIKNGLPWAADLGCLSGPAYVKKIQWEKVFPWLSMMSTYRSTCLFLAGFDVVEDATNTFEAFGELGRYFESWPLAYVVQNGAENLPLPDCAAIFLGGSTEYKCSETAVEVIKRAQSKKMHIHIGRVNTWKRYRMFRLLDGSDSFTCDGTKSRFVGIEKANKLWRKFEAQVPLVRL